MNEFFKLGQKSIQGRRYSQEDRIHIEKSGSMIWVGVYDGHGGQIVVNHAVNNLYKNFLTLYSTKNNEGEDNNKLIEESLIESFEITDGQLKKSQQGTTATVAILELKNNFVNIWFSHVGDSRGLFFVDGKIIYETPDHNYLNTAEIKRITECGGFMWGKYVNACLAVTRAIGDWGILGKDDDELILSTPDTKNLKYQLGTKNSGIVIASDGLWDVMSNDEVIKMILSQKTAQLATEKLCEEAFNRGTGDNTSVVVIRF